MENVKGDIYMLRGVIKTKVTGHDRHFNLYIGLRDLK